MLTLLFWLCVGLLIGVAAGLVIALACVVLYGIIYCVIEGGSCLLDAWDRTHEKEHHDLKHDPYWKGVFHK